ncbi:unnamed protein product [Schistosoma rodhaini]|uniref:Vitellogenin domain-containing protein n=1 Tax=Schistosoma rodhaini TaxID=6188 RepID=A0AA85EM14_9TREM|nr:unnamed protein product [Schistosoma rodhaini]
MSYPRHFSNLQVLMIIWNIIYHPTLLINANDLYTNDIIVTHLQIGYQYTYKWKIIHEIYNSYQLTNEKINDNNKINNQIYIIEGLAKIISGPNCDMRLSLHHVEEPGEIQTTRNLSYHEKYPIKFCLSNGRLLSFEYLSQDEISSVRIKKALLFQLQMSSQTYGQQFYTVEIDHLGSCQTEYVLKTVNLHTVTMIKKRNSMFCNDEYQPFFIKDNSKLNDQQFTINNRPLYLQSDLICELTHKLNGPITNVNCQETSITQQQWFPSFSINTLTLNVNMQINLTGETEYNDEFIEFDGISKMDFEFPDKNQNQTVIVNNFLIENNFTNHNYINMIMNSPEKFSYFIEQLKCLTYEQWKIVYNSWEENIQTNEIRNFLENVILEVQTESSIIFIINHFIVNAKNEYKQLKWINHLSIMKKPTIEMMKEIKSLLTSHLYNHTVYYVSVSIKQFCEDHPSCIKTQIIHEMMNIIENSVDLQDNIKSLKTLEIIENIGQFLSSQKIIKIIEKDLMVYNNSDNNLRLYVGQIIDHFPCEPYIDNHLWSIFLNTNESNELRITIFNSLIKCLTHEKILKILKILNKSLDNQIRSYVISKLFSLLKTHDPSKMDLYLNVRKYEYEITQLNKDNGFLFAIRNSGYHEWIQKTKYGIFFIELSTIYESYSILPNTIKMRLKYQNKEKLSNVFDVVYQYGSETFLYKFLINLIKTITSTYVPWMKDYTVNIDNQTQTFRKYDSIFIKWFDKIVFHSSNISYQLQNWFSTTKTFWSQPIELNHAKHLWKSKNEHPLLSGFYIEWETNVISYMNSYMNSVYSLNPYQFSLFINHKSKFYTSQKVQLVSGSHEIFGFQSDRKIDCNFHVNNSLKLATDSNNLLLEILFDPWSYNYELFKYTKNDFFMKNGKPYLDFQLSKLNHWIITTFKPFNWFHLIIEKLCHSENIYSLIQVYQININEVKGFFLKFNYLSMDEEENNNKINRISFLIHRTNVSMQQNYETKNNNLQFNLKINNQNDSLRHVDLKLSVFQKDSYHLIIDITEDGLIQAVGYFNQQRMIRANGSLDVKGNDTNARIQLYNPSINLNISFRKYHNSLFVMQAINQADYFPFQFSLINYVTNQPNLKMLGMNAFQTSISFNVSNFINIYWSFNLNSTEDNNPPSYYSTTLFNVTIFEHFLIYQNSIYWNETLNNKTTVNTNENDKNITIKTKAQSSVSNHFDYECTINMFKTKEFLTPYYGQPTKFYINIYVVSPNRSSLRQFSLLTNHGVNIQHSRSIKTSVTSTFADEKKGFILNNELEWKLTDIGTINRLHSTTDIYCKSMKESIKLILLHDIENQLLSSILMEYNDQDHQKIYSIKSWLQPWRNQHEFTFQWPNLKIIQILTIYDIIPIDLYSGITLDHLIYFNHYKYFIIKNQIMFKLDEQKLFILHQTKRFNTTYINQLSNISNHEDIISQLELILQFYYNINLIPLHIKFICESKIKFLLLNYKINKNIMGKLKLNFKKLNGDILVELFNNQLNNQFNDNIQLNINYDFNYKSIINIIFKINIQSNIQNHLLINWKSINDSLYFIINCKISSFIYLIYHFKHRWHNVDYHIEGSNMLSVQSFLLNHWFSGFYLNSNYILQLNLNQKLFEIRTEYSTTNSLGPGSPIRIRINFKHDKSYKHGNLEVGLDSQLIGHYIGYEMMNTMMEYQLDSSDNKKSIDFISRCLIGYRLYEGRGTKGYQIELFIIQYQNDYQFDILFKIGRPGLIHHNIIEYNHLLQSNQTKFQISTIYLNKPYFYLNFDIQFIETLLFPIYSNISLFIPWNNLRFIVKEQLNYNKSSSIIQQNLLIFINQSITFYYFNQSLYFKNKLMKSSNVYNYLYLQWNTNIISSHMSSILFYKYIKNIMNTTVYEQFFGDWNSSIYLLFIQNYFNNSFNIYYNLTDQLWNNKIHGNITKINEIKYNYSIHKYNYCGNHKISLYHIDFQLNNTIIIYIKQINNYKIKNLFEFISFQNQTNSYEYSMEHSYKQKQSDFVSYNLFTTANNKNILNIDLQLQSFNNFQFSIKIIPNDLINIQLIDIQLKNNLSIRDIDWFFNGSIEILPYLPKILSFIKIHPIISDLNENLLPIQSKPFQFSILIQNTNDNSEWKLFNMSVVQTLYNQSNIQVLTLYIQSITPYIKLPYVTMTENKLIQPITNNRTTNDLIEYNHIKNDNQSNNIELTLLQINNNNLSISININKKYKIFLEIKKIIMNSSSIHFINISLFDQRNQLGNYLQTIKINQLNKQTIYQLKNYLCIINNNNNNDNNNIHNLSIKLINSNKQNNILFNLITLNFYSNLPILIKHQINEINIYLKNNNKIDPFNNITILNYSLQINKQIYYQLQSELIINKNLLFLKYEINLKNQLIKFKQNQNYLIEINLNQQTNYSIIFKSNKNYLIISYDIFQSLFFININNFLYFKTNIFKFISILLHTTDNLNHQKQNIQQITTQSSLINNENNSIDFILVSPNYIDLNFQFQLYNDITQTYRFITTNLNLSSNLLYIPSLDFLFSIKHNIVSKRLVTKLDHYGYTKNLLCNNVNQSNLMMQANTPNNENKFIIVLKSYLQMYKNTVYNSNIHVNFHRIIEKITPYTIDININKMNEQSKNLYVQVYAKYDPLDQNNFITKLIMKNEKKSIHFIMLSDLHKSQVISLLNSNISNDNNEIYIDYLSEDQKKAVYIRTSLRNITYSIESNQLIINENNIYKNKTIKYELINVKTSKRKKDIKIKLISYQNYILDSDKKEDDHMERLHYAGFILNTNILKQGSINILSKISKSPDNTQLIVTMNHGHKSAADHQFIVTWPHVFQEKHYPLLFLKTLNKTLNLTGAYFQQSGILNTSLQIITNEHHTQCKFYWKKWNSIHLLIDNHLELNYNLIYQNYNNNIYHIKYDYYDIFQVIYQLHNQDRNMVVNNGDLLAIKSVIGSDEHKTILQVKINKNYGAMLQVTSHHQSINQSNLNGRLIVHLDHSNILHLFSYWRPEICEDVSLSINEFPKQFNSLIQLSFAKIYQYGQQLIILFSNDFMNSINEIQLNQFINIIHNDLKYTSHLFLYWFNNELFNISIFKNRLPIKLNITKLDIWENFQELKNTTNSLTQFKLNLVQYFDSIYKSFLIYIESNIQQKIVDNINPLLNYMVNTTIQKSEEFSKDSIKGLKLSFNAFDAFWYSMVEIYSIWIEIPSKINEIIYNLLVNDTRNSGKLENITVYLKHVNERLNIAQSLFESIRNNISTIGQCARNRISEQWRDEKSNYEQLSQFIQLIKQKQIEESYKILFKPHLRNFIKSMNKNQYYVKIYIPQLIKIFTHYMPKIWPYYMQILEEQSKMKSQINHLTNESNNFV